MDPDTGGLVHAVMFYRDDAELLDAAIPFVREGLDRGERVLLALPARNLALVRDALGEAAGEVEMNDMAQIGGNPARTFAAMRALCDQHKGKPVRMFAEPVWPGRGGDVYPACVQNEALWNEAFSADPMITLCPYNIAGLSDDVVADARATHPLIWRDGALTASPDYAGADALARANQPLPLHPSATTFILRHLEDLSPARAFAAEYAERAGLTADRVKDLELIVTELATNSLKYTDGPCRVALWGGPSTEGLICQVSDDGHLADPLAGRRIPDGDSTTGRGLLLINAIADLVRTHTAPNGTTIRVYLDREPAA